MSSRRRLGLLLTLFPIAFYAYACSDDPAPADAPDTDGGTSDTGTMPVEDDGGTGGPDADVGDGGAIGCTGNPLTGEDMADGGDDGGAMLDPDGGALRAIATGRFLDGPQWIEDDAGGAIVYSEVDSQVIVRNAPDGGARVVLRATGLGNLPIGNARGGDYVYTAMSRLPANGGGGAILRMLVDGGEPTEMEAGVANSPNDLVASAKGFVYFTDPGYQTDGISTGVFRLGPDGTVTTITKYDGGAGNRADGIALSPDESTLFVSFFDTKRITRYTLDAEGVASDPQSVPVTLADNPTGIAVDLGGNLWVAESPDGDLGAAGRIEVFAPDGSKWGEIPFADSRPNGIAFGGADGKTVYVTTERGNVLEGTLYAFTSRCPGVR